MSKHKFAVFDIDGTIFRWQLYHELFDALVDRSMIPLDVATEVFTAREDWRNRRISYNDYETVMVRMMNPGIVGLEEVEFNEIADNILQSKGHHVYRYTVALMKKLKKEGYKILGISGSYQQLVDRFAKLHSIDIAVGREHTVVNGKMTADSTEVFGRKDEILRELISTHHLDERESYGIGDSASDIAMLKCVQHPIAFNPDKELQEAAYKNGWTIVVERKNLAYRLERNGDGVYILAATDNF